MGMLVGMYPNATTYSEVAASRARIARTNTTSHGATSDGRFRKNGHPNSRNIKRHKQAPGRAQHRPRAASRLHKPS